MTAVIPIVEGHGEQRSVRDLLQRIGYELLGGVHIEVLRPIRIPRSRIVREDELAKAVELAARKCLEKNRSDALILILLDADSDPACQLGPELTDWATSCRSDFHIATVIIVVEYETWFVGGAESLLDFLEVDLPAPENPEAQRHAKTWIRERFRRPSYTETIDQPAMTAAVDLSLVRQRCPSFARLCNILEHHVAATLDTSGA